MSLFYYNDIMKMLVNPLKSSDQPSHEFPTLSLLSLKLFVYHSQLSIMYALSFIQISKVPCPNWECNQTSISKYAILFLTTFHQQGVWFPVIRKAKPLIMEWIVFWKIFIYWNEMVVKAFNPSTQKAQARRSLPDLHSEIQTS